MAARDVELDKTDEATDWIYVVNGIKVNEVGQWGGDRGSVNNSPGKQGRCEEQTEELP